MSDRSTSLDYLLKKALAHLRQSRLESTAGNGQRVMATRTQDDKRRKLLDKADGRE